MMATTIGVRRPSIVMIERAMASAMPRSSDAAPGCAPAVSTRVTTGRCSFSARRKMRIALRKPSGWALPKLRRMFSSVSLPFCWPTNMIGRPSRRAKPATIAPSSPK